MIIFLSAVSDEFQKTSETEPSDFTPYRDILSKSLRRLGPRYQVIVQSELAQGFGDLLQTLDRELESADILVHLVGDMAGFAPTPTETRRLRERWPDLMGREPELSGLLRSAESITYTQWEYYLALHHGRKRLVFLAEPETPRSPMFRTELSQIESQKAHIERIQIAGEHREAFADQLDLALKVITSIVRMGLGESVPARVPSEGMIEDAKAEPGVLVFSLAEEIRKNPGSERALDPAGIEGFLRAIDTVALKRELDRRTTLEIAESHRLELQAAMPPEPDGYELQELAFAEMAVGRYREALATVEKIIARIGYDPETLLEAAEFDELMSANMLGHEIAGAAGLHDKAVEFLQTAMTLIDTRRDPLLWADFADSLANYNLNIGRSIEAAKLAEKAVETRQNSADPDLIRLANSALILANCLVHTGEFAAAADAAHRAAEIFGSDSKYQIIFSSALLTEAQALAGLAQFERALSLIRSSIAICEEHFDADDPMIAGGFHSLASLLLENDSISEAEAPLLRALDIHRSAHGMNHPRVAMDLSLLGAYCLRTGKASEAESYIRESISIFEAVYGPDHGEIAICLNNLGALKQDTDPPASLACYRSAEAILKQTAGTAHPDYGKVCGNIAVVLNRMGQFEESIELVKQSISILDQSLGSDHPNTLIFQGHLENFLQAFEDGTQPK